MAEQEMQQAAGEAGQTLEINEFESLLTREFKPKTVAQKESVAQAVKTLAQQVMEEVATIPADAEEAIEAIIAELDRKLSEQVDRILHHPEFQQLEGTWRGLAHLVNNTETDEKLKIKVFNISKNELAKTFKKFKGAKWDQSPLFKHIYEEQFGTPGGEPYGCLIGDYSFNHSAPDVSILEGMAQVAAAAHAPFITSPDPSLLNMDSWQELHKPRDLTKIFGTAEYAGWRSLRESADAQYLSMVMPRTLARLPYGPNTNPVEEFNYLESTGAADHSRYTWTNAAYAMGVNINRSFKLYGWCTAIRGVENGGMVEGLPVHTFPTDDGGVDMKCPTEVAITDRREAELSKNGFLPLCHWKNTDYAVFIGAQSLQKPAEYDDPDASSNANLAARLPYTFATCRFAHYLKCIVRDKLGSFAEREDMERFLNNWITNYVTVDPKASQEMKARYPLAAAEVVVEEVEGNPGYYTSKFFLKPHYQLEGLTVSLRLVSKLPSAKAS
jgi:type VI secretion system protein ImpC